MEETQTQPLYWDKHRIPFNLTLIFSIGVAAFGAFSFIFQGENPLLLFAGLGVAAYAWFTNPREYLIYPDALYVVYGKPRVKAIPFSNISRLEMRALATPDRLRVWPKSGRRVVLMARNPEAFYEQLDQALGDYRSTHPEEEYYDEEPAAELPRNDTPAQDAPVVEDDQPESNQSPEDDRDNSQRQSPY